MTDLFGLTITGNGAANTIVQAAASAGTATYRVFKINAGTVTLEAMTIRYGVEASGGGINNAAGTLTFNNVILTGNQVKDLPTGLNGGGLSANGGNTTINNSTISNNSVTTSDTSGSVRGSGGGIFIGTTGSITINNSTVSGNPLGGSGSANGNFSTGARYTIDKTAPTAGSLVAANVTTSGGTTYRFTITFSDNQAIDRTSLDGSDIRVSGPGGFNQLATLVSVAPDGNGTPRTATYQSTAPGGAWDIADQGTYTIALEANQVMDTVGNPVGATSLAASWST